MLTSSQRLVAALAFTFFAGSLTGYFVGRDSPATTPARNPKPSTGELSSRIQPGEETTRELEQEGPDSSSHEALPEAELSRRVLGAVRVRDYFRRRYEIYAVGQLLNRDSIRSAMEATQQFGDSDRENAQYALVARWLELDPAAAYDWVRALPAQKRRADLTREFFHSLGMKDPTTALSFLAQYGADPNRGDDLTHSVFEAWSAYDPAAAVDAAFNLTKSDSQRSALGVALGRWAKTNPQGALSRVAQLPEGEGRRENLRTVLREWAEEDPQAAASHVLGMPDGKERTEALAAVLSGAAGKDREAAMRLVEQLPAGVARTNALRQIVGEIAYNQPNFAADLVLQLPPGQQRNSVYQVVHHLARRDRAAALEWAEKLGSLEARRAATQNIMQQWANDDPKAAAEYCASHEVGGPEFIRSAVAGWARNDAPGALAWARSLPDDSQREVALASGISALGASDPYQAVNLAATMLSGNKQAEAYGSIAHAWASTDPAAAAVWAAKLSDASVRMNAVSNIASAWARQDPAAVAAWALRMPDNRNVLPTIAHEWATQDPAATARWLDTVPGGDVRDSAVSNFARAVADSDPEGAATWAATISQAGQRDSTMGDVFRQWKRADPKAANAWLKTTPAISAEARERMLRWND